MNYVGIVFCEAKLFSHQMNDKIKRLTRRRENEKRKSKKWKLWAFDYFRNRYFVADETLSFGLLLYPHSIIFIWKFNPIQCFIFPYDFFASFSIHKIIEKLIHDLLLLWWFFSIFTSHQFELAMKAKKKRVWLYIRIWG